MAVVQSRGKQTWVKTGRDLASHFVEIIDRKLDQACEVHVVFDRYFSDSEGEDSPGTSGYQSSNSIPDFSGCCYCQVTMKQL